MAVMGICHCMLPVVVTLSLPQFPCRVPALCSGLLLAQGRPCDDCQRGPQDHAGHAANAHVHPKFRTRSTFLIHAQCPSDRLKTQTAVSLFSATNMACRRRALLSCTSDGSVVCLAVLLASLTIDGVLARSISLDVGWRCSITPSSLTLHAT